MHLSLANDMPDVPPVFASDHRPATKLAQPPMRLKDGYKLQRALTASDEIGPPLIDVGKRDVGLLPRVVKPIQQAGRVAELRIDFRSLEKPQRLIGVVP